MGGIQRDHSKVQEGTCTSDFTVQNDVLKKVTAQTNPSKYHNVPSLSLDAAAFSDHRQQMTILL